MAKNFEFGDLVWAKMKHFSFWPGTIEPNDAKKKNQYYVRFFGTNDCAWILDKFIMYHSEEAVKKAQSKKMSSVFKSAVDNIIHEHSLRSTHQRICLASISEAETEEKSVSQDKGKEDKGKEDKGKEDKGKGDKGKEDKRKEDKRKEDKRKEDKKKEDKGQLPTISPTKSESETVKVKPFKPFKIRPLRSAVKKDKLVRKTPLKRRIEELQPEPKLLKTDDSFTDLFNNISSSLNANSRVAIIKPYDDKSASVSQSFGGNIVKRDYFNLLPTDPLEMKTLSENMMERKESIIPTRKRIGFLGLGNMGQRIVKNLLLTGHYVTIWNRSLVKCQPFKDIGAVIVTTPADVVERADITFSCVSDSEVVESLVLGNCGVLSGLEGSRCLSGTKGYVEMTTIDSQTSVKIADAILRKGGRYLEAPICGSRTLAENGLLSIVAAGDEDLFMDCRSCFDTISKSTYYLGKEIGSGSKMNLITNAMLGISYASLAESLVLVERLGLNTTNFLEILQLGPLNCDVLVGKGNAMCQREFQTDTSLKYLQQDLCMTLLMGGSMKQPMHVTAAANNLYKHAELLRYSEHDVAAVYFGAKY